MHTRNVDVAVIGGGPAGYSLSIRLAQHGFEVVCIEREHVGGVCLNWGCIPSKALITAARRYQFAKDGARMGVIVPDVRFDFALAHQNSQRIVSHHVEGVSSLIRSNGGEVLVGSAEFESPDTLLVRSATGTEQRVRATRAVVIACGVALHEPRGFEPDGEFVVSAREAVFPQTLPKHLLVLGGGVIGLELGSAYQALGSKLTVVELGPELLPGVDADLVRVLEKRLVGAGAQLLTRARALAWSRDTAGGVRLLVEHQGSERWLEGDRLLLATGFRPKTSELGLVSAGVKLDATGHIGTDAACRTSSPNVFAIGDVTGPPYLAHKGFKEAEVCLQAILGKPAARDWRAMPSAIFTDPEIATVGLSERAAREAGLVIEVGRFPFSALGRAMALGTSDGFVKIIAHQQRIVGVAAVGPEVSELIAEAALAIEMGASPEDLALTVHPHPTLSEATREAAEHLLGGAVHVMNRKRSAA